MERKAASRKQEKEAKGWHGARPGLTEIQPNSADREDRDQPARADGVTARARKKADAQATVANPTPAAVDPLL